MEDMRHALPESVRNYNWPSVQRDSQLLADRCAPGLIERAMILALLRDGMPHTSAEIHRVCGYSRLNSRIAELRKRGWNIECRHVEGKSGVEGYAYRLIPAAAFVRDVDESAGLAELFDVDPYSRKVPA